MKKQQSIYLIEPNEFNIYGCELSTDIDIAIKIDDPNLIQLFKQNKLKINMDKIIEQLTQSGYDTANVKIDINLLYFGQNNNLSMCLKGSKDVQNCIILTYDKHKQSHDCFFTPNQIVESDIEDRLRGFSKYVMDNMKEMLGLDIYAKLRSTKANCYLNIQERNIFSIKVLRMVNWSSLFETIDGVSLIKSMTMKICQLIMHNNNLFAHTKKEIAQIASTLIPISYNNLIFLLTRKTLGHLESSITVDNLFTILIDNVEQTINELINKYVWQSINANSYVDNSIGLDDGQKQMLEEFIKSPAEPNKNLITLLNEQLTKITATTTAITTTTTTEQKLLNQLFILFSSNCDQLPSRLLLNHIYTENQRSVEWLELLKTYNCGNTPHNQHVKFTDIVTNYNLIRGCLMEQFLLNKINWLDIISDSTHIIPCMCGLLVEQKTDNIELRKTIKGVAPDLLLIDKTNNRIIPVEFKCLLTDPKQHNSKYYREIKLASKQILSSLNIINNALNDDTANTSNTANTANTSNTIDTNKYGLIVFGYIWPINNTTNCDANINTNINTNNKITIKYCLNKYELS